MTAKDEQASAYDAEQQALSKQLAAELVEKMVALSQARDLKAHTIATALLGAACEVAQSYMTKQEFAAWLAGIAEAHASIGTDPKDLN